MVLLGTLFPIPTAPHKVILELKTKILTFNKIFHKILNF